MRFCYCRSRPVEQTLHYHRIRRAGVVLTITFDDDDCIIAGTTAPDYKTFSWAELQAAMSAPIVNMPLNAVETLASSADDFVSYSRRGLHGHFFKNAQTLNEYRRILSLGDVTYIVDFPLGTSVFAMGGSIDVPGFHCLCVPAGMFFNNR